MGAGERGGEAGALYVWGGTLAEPGRGLRGRARPFLA